MTQKLPTFKLHTTLKQPNFVTLKSNLLQMYGVDFLETLTYIF